MRRARARALLPAAQTHVHVRRGDGAADALSYDCVVWAAGAAPVALLAHTDLARCTRGFLRVHKARARAAPSAG